ncbi:MAG: MarR family transcriptional regulator [Nocardioidaceae bacterium]|nr:MarR family transcriptional regulator [Nocardioidaceae bacterium]NUS50704.1 MarR family transcriptional regulator [Nocardioidaceae bacterium]
MTGTDPDDHQRLLHAVERVATLLTEAGMPPMASRVFAYALADDSDRYTAAELAAGLRVSPAAISGAVRYLLDTRLLFKEREPGRRADIYRVYDDDVWSAIMLARLPMLEMWEQAVAEAADLVGPDHRGGRRLRETQEYFRFTREETRAMVERWREHRKTLT